MFRFMVVYFIFCKMRDAASHFTENVNHKLLIFREQNLVNYL